MSKNIPIVKGPVTGPNPMTVAAATASKSRLTANAVYPGTVSDIDPVTHTMTVMVEKQKITKCVFAANAIASYMGFAPTTLPPVGASVLVIYAPSGSFVLGVQPGVTDSTTQFSGFFAGDKDINVNDQEAFKFKSGDSKGATPTSYPTSRDIVPGEWEFGNNMGVVLRLLTNFVQLGAGDLARVECCLLNDMVRIVDNYFVHHSVGGDEMIYSNGRCNMEQHFTSYPHEAEGKVSPGDSLVDISDGVVDGSSINDPYGETGRWRKSTYTGFLGDMIHTWVTDPTTVISNVGEEEARRAGKMRSWIGADGTVMIQTVAGVHVEVVPKIVVPIIKQAWNSPDATVQEKIDDLEKDFLTLWGKGPDWADLSVACWQMRAYAKYITLFHSLSRFAQMESEGMVKIPTEKESPDPDPTCAEADKRKANPNGGTPYGASASFTMDPSGSITMVSGGMSSFIFNQGNLHISVPGNMEFHAGGRISMSSKNWLVKTLHQIEIASIAGSIKMKARTAIDSLCELGRIWLKSDKGPDKEEDLQKAKDHYPLEEEMEGGIPIPTVSNFGVIIDSSKHNVLIHGATGIVAAATENEAQILVESLGADSKIRVVAPYIRVLATLGMHVKSVINFTLATTRAKVAAGIIQLGSRFRLTEGSLEYSGFMRTERVISKGGYMGPSTYISKPKDANDLVPQREFLDTIEDSKVAAAVYVENTAWDVLGKELNLYKWSFDSWPAATDVLDFRSLKASPYDDSVRILDKSEFHVPMKWELDKLVIPGQPRTNEKNVMWPGSGAKQFVFEDESIPPLGTVWDKQFTKDMIKTAGDMKPKDFTITFNKSIV